MAQKSEFSIKIVSTSKRCRAILCYTNPTDGLYVEKVLTKDSLYNFISRHIPCFSRYANSVRHYNYKELCDFVAFQDKYTFLPFNVVYL